MSAHKRTSFIVVLACLGTLALAAALLRRDSGAERLGYRPAGSDADAQALVARLLETNRPWLDPKLVRAAYSVLQTSLEWQLGEAWQQRSLRRLYRQWRSTNTFTVKWRSEPGRRVGTWLQTPLTAMLQSRSNYTARMVGKGRWHGKTVVAVDASFHPAAAVRADSLYRAGMARILIEPGHAIPLFIGTSQAGSFGAKPRFESTFEFGPDFFRLDGGRAPRLLEWRGGGRMKTHGRYEFQLFNNFWFFKRGRMAGPITGQWSRASQRLELIGLRAEPLASDYFLQEYPTTLTTGDPSPDRARAWEFTPEDIFCVSRFKLEAGAGLRVELGPGDLGIGHCADGAVWAVLIPRQGGTLASRAANGPERIAHLGLRFHPKELGRLFPLETLSLNGAADLRPQMLAIANLKMMSGWQAGGMATIPEPNEMVVDVDTQDGPRRCFAVDTRAGTARYAGELEAQPVDLSPEAMAVNSHPLPDHRPEILAEARDSTRPKVISVTPAQDAPAVAPITELRLRFDQPMDPLALGLAWESGACLAWDPPQYDPARYEFVIPVRLTPGVLHQVVINRPTQGFAFPRFRSTEAKAAALFVWRFVTQRARADVGNTRPEAPTRADAPGDEAREGSQHARLLRLLETMKQRRAQVTSITERVQSLSEPGGELWLGVAAFKWQQPNCFYADVTQMMMMSLGAFRIGCDGRNWWWHFRNDGLNQLAVCPTNEMQVANVSICDPFGLTTRSPAEAAKAMGLSFAGVTNRAGTDYYLVVAMPAPVPTGVQFKMPSRCWWVDARTYLPAEVDQGSYRLCFLYDSINQPVPADAFAVPKSQGVSLKPPEALDATYTQRFVNILDGSSGSVNVRWGKVGPTARSSSGIQ